MYGDDLWVLTGTKNDWLFGLWAEEIRKGRRIHNTLGIHNHSECLIWSNFLIAVTKYLDRYDLRKEIVWFAV